ncbi:MAG: dimethylsulfoxide reductase subunit B [Candidatus Atribacteria bacterium]|nr:dimethylsulfoxide reductase subunit B [Candidatus Atribacteria bacterium]
MSKQLAFYVDTSKCTGCKTCQVACQDKNNLPAEILWRRVFTYGGGSWNKKGNIYVPNNIFRYYVSTACQHCQEPKCVEVCPTGAMHKDQNGIVSVNAETCIGCRYCEWACPYGAPQFNEELGVMTKCDMCKDYVAEGKRPACVDSCVTRCMDFGELEELRAKYGDIDAIEPLPSGKYTKPSLVLTPHRDAQPAGSGTGKIANMPEEL